MTIQRIKQLVQEDFTAVNALIIEKIQAETGLIDDLANHIVQSGGKRLRPLIVLLASHACGYQGQDHLLLAAMIEFFHTATLLHDDVIDESTLRRGQETANNIWGSKASILVGDYLLTQYMQFMLDVGDLEIMRLLTEVTLEITRGELKQLANRYEPPPSLQDYFDIIRAKTSLLFSASAELGALISHASIEQRQALSTYGLHVGNAFQLIDDALDYCSSAATMGKNIGDDLANGKATLPFIHALENVNPAQRQQLEKCLKTGSRDDIATVLKAIEETKAIAYTKEMARIEVTKAIEALPSIPNSAYKQALIDIANYAIHRNH